MFILDTNTLIYFFKNIGNVAEHLLSQPSSKIAIPAIVVFELEVGIAKSTSPKKRKSQLHQLFSSIQIIDFGDKEAQTSAMIRADLESKGMPIGPYDTLIAGTALAHQATLVTHNTAEFVRVKKLQLEDWF